MRKEVHRRLTELREAQGMEYGKLVQKLLALAFLEAGATRVVGRTVEGIDLEVTLPGGRACALEVKTTQGEAVSVGAKDLQGLEARRAEGFETFLAVLGPHLLDDWVFARVQGEEIRPLVSYPPTLLRAWRDATLEAFVAESFPRVVLAHAPAAAVGGQGALNALLAARPGFARA